MSRRLANAHVALVAALAATLVVQAGSLTGGLHDDDYLHLFALVTRPCFEFVTASYAGHIMVLPKLVLASMHAVFGATATPYLLLALATHLFNVALIYRVATRFGAGPWMAGAVALLWGTAPVQQSTLSWMSTYGFMLGTATTLLALGELGRGRDARRPASAAELVRANLFVALGALSLGAATAVALVFPVVAWLLATPPSPGPRAALSMLPSWLFTVFAVSLIERPPISLDPGVVTTLIVHLAAYGVAAVFAGPVATNTAYGIGIFRDAPAGLATRLSFVIAAPILAALAYAALRSGRETRRTVLGLTTPTVAIYGAIAANRAVSATVLSIGSVALQDRYHYSPTVGVVLAFAVAASHLVARSWNPALRTRALLAASAALVTLASLPVALGHRTRETAAWAQGHVRLTEEALTTLLTSLPEGDVYLRNENFTPALLAVVIGNDRSVFPGIAAYWAVSRDSTWQNGRGVHFVDSDPRLLAALPRMNPEVRALFASPQDAQNAAAVVHSFDEIPAALRDRLRQSVDPVLKDSFQPSMNR